MAYQTKGRDPLFDRSMQDTLRKRGKELMGLGLLICGLGLAAILFSYAPDDPSMMSASDAPVQNWLGRFGAGVAAPVVMIVGAGGWAIALLSVVWGLRFTLHVPDLPPVGRLVFAPVFVILVSVYAGTLNTAAGWPHAFGLGGLFGDTALGALLGLLPMPIDAAIRLLALIMGIGSAVLGLFVMGFTLREFHQGFRLLLIGLVLGYMFLLRLLGRGAAGTWRMTSGAAARAAEGNRNRREARLARRHDMGDWGDDQVWQEEPPVSQGWANQPAPEWSQDWSRHEDNGQAWQPTLHDPQDPSWQGDPDDYPYDVYEEVEQEYHSEAEPLQELYAPAEEPPRPEPRGLLGRLIRRAEPEMPQSELIPNDPVTYLPADDGDLPGDERIRSKIENAVRSSRQRTAVIRKTRPAAPQRHPRGPKPLVFDPKTRSEPPLMASEQTGLPPEPPVSAPPTSYRPVGAAPTGAAPLGGAPVSFETSAYPDMDAPELSEAPEAPPWREGPDSIYPTDPEWAMDVGDIGPTPPVPQGETYVPEAYPLTAEEPFDETAFDGASAFDKTDFERPDDAGEPPAETDDPLPRTPAPRLPSAEPKKVVQHTAPRAPQQSEQARKEAQPGFGFVPEEAKYALPPLSLLRNPESITRHHLSDDALEENARMLESVLDDYGVKGEIVSVRPGPVVTMYELEPAPGLKASRVIGLADDIARSMSALSARVSTVPGRSVIGIELPNDNREMVVLREILAAKDFGDSHMKLPLALGKDIGGESMVANLAKMPHLLIAGTTGSGKSVAINTMILSLLYRLTPEECRLIMIDPKMLELSVYDGIPHLLSPVVTDPKKAVVALKWVVAEMEERYRKMSKMGVRNIDGYNGRVADALAKNETFSRTVQTGFDDETGDPVFETEEIQPEKMPYIVVIVDEMADLMMVAGKEIEACIQRLAQMARASGIHLIMATQRPSVDVITGTIKANFPTRISFQVTSKIDSRTILGEMGAEQLLGMGDMLYMAGGARITRCHGPFVSDEEVEEIVNHLKGYGPPEYIGGVVDGPEDDKADDIDAVLGLGGNTNGEDALYDQAVGIVIKDRKCSTSYIQRKLAIGYNKAARLVEQMEDEGVVSSANHVGKREVLVPEQ
ncbi:DNA translocase FtsK [Pseudooceanicola algae]|uniref:DNA translocase FtsK n=1 Tax=Pseudooceanicola algae TaxID=1537215 RepID=A0A418SG24_9RHOB|nr:DNA translocase FtsK [Pseudooceanicola algae]QPM91616.1 hypothetical protein PSAL_028710 [Pseudooceanicola algae]